MPVLECQSAQLSKNRDLLILNDLRQDVEAGAAIIVFVRTGELLYWDRDTPHALVIVGIEADIIYVNDPAFESAPIAMAIGDFMLAWDEFGNQYAIVRRF